MNVTPAHNPIPFTEQNFNLEVTGTELALIKWLVSQCAIGTTQSLGKISHGIYSALQKYNTVDCDDFNGYMNESIPTIPTGKISLNDFERIVNNLAK